MTRIAWAAGAPFRLVLLGAISLYRLLFAGMLAGRCRFHPSCSAYALEAIRLHGALRGSVLAAWRVLRCSPLTAGGLDPVPPSRHHRPTGVTSSYRMTASNSEGRGGA